MSIRKAGNFIQAYVEQHDNGYVPARFYIWSAISTIAATLERKVWLPWFHGNVYPNMYVFLVAGPSAGKSSAIRPGVKLIKKCNEINHSLIRLLPNQTTEAQLLDILSEHDYFTYKNKQYAHSSAYLVASEASMCFKNSEEHAIVKALTTLYDPDDFKKETVSRQNAVNITNPCINVIAGSTFHDLGAFLHKQGILGGFASRCTFVVEKEKKKKASGWYEEDQHQKKKEKISADLVHDLGCIYKLSGSFKATEEVKSVWAEWEEDYLEARVLEENEIKRAFMARKMLGMQKLIQILSAAESDDMIIKLAHWEMAKKLIDQVERDIPGMLLEGQASDTSSSNGVKATIIRALAKEPGRHTKASLLAITSRSGHDPAKLSTLIRILSEDPTFATQDATGRLTLVSDPNFHL